MQDLDYWTRLRKLKMYSLERRRERYVVIYIWKMIENVVPNIGVEVKHHQRLGRSCKLPTLVKHCDNRTKTLRENSIKTFGAKLFNSLPGIYLVKRKHSNVL